MFAEEVLKNPVYTIFFWRAGSFIIKLIFENVLK
jgi:hypothetical protein